MILKKAVRFGDEKLRCELYGYIEYIKKHELYNSLLKVLYSTYIKKNEQYNSLLNALSLTHNPGQLLVIKEKLSDLNFDDSSKMAEQCEEKYDLEMEILDSDKKRCAELKPVFHSIAKKEEEIIDKTNEAENTHFDNNARVPAQDSLDAAQAQMNKLMKELGTLGVFKKKEKEAISAQIVEIGKEISRLNQNVENEKKQLKDAFQDKKYYLQNHIHQLVREVEEEKESLYNEAVQNEEK